MLLIRPVSDLRNHFSDIEKNVSEGETIYLTKNGYGSMVVMSLETYSDIVSDIESKLDEADYQAKNTDIRLSHDEVFGKIRENIKNARV